MVQERPVIEEDELQREGPGLQERLGGRPFRAETETFLENPDAWRDQRAPREAGVLRGHRDGRWDRDMLRARGPCLTPGTGPPWALFSPNIVEGQVLRS